MFFSIHSHILQVILFEIGCVIFYTNLHELFFSVHKVNKLGKILVNCQVMADMKKVYDDLIIIYLYVHTFLPDFRHLTHLI